MAFGDAQVAGGLALRLGKTTFVSAIVSSGTVGALAGTEPLMHHDVAEKLILRPRRAT